MHISILSPHKDIKDSFTVALADHLGAHKILLNNIPNFFAALYRTAPARFALLQQNDAYGQILLTLWQVKDYSQLISSASLLEEIIHTDNLFQAQELSEKDYQLSLAIAEEHCKALPDFDLYFLLHYESEDYNTNLQQIANLEHIHHVNSEKIMALAIKPQMTKQDWQDFLRIAREKIHRFEEQESY